MPVCKQFLQNTRKLFEERGCSFLGQAYIRICLCIRVGIWAGGLLEQEESRSWGRGQPNGTGCRKLRKASCVCVILNNYLAKGLVSASCIKPVFDVCTLLLCSLLHTGITSLDMLSKAICRLYMWSIFFLHGQDLLFSRKSMEIK